MIAHLHTEYLSRVDIVMAGLDQFFCLPVKVCLYQDKPDFPESQRNAAGEHLDLPSECVLSLKHTPTA